MSKLTELPDNLLNDLPDYLFDSVEKCAETLTEDELVSVIALLIEFQVVFSSGEFDIGRTGFFKHRVATPGASSCRHPLRCSSPEQRVEVERQVKNLLERNLIRLSDVHGPVQ